MNHKNHLSQHRSKRWLRLGFSGLLALICLFIPLTAGTLISIPFPTRSPEQPTANMPAPILDFSVPFGISLVQATNGLTITKSGASFIDQGEILTYTVDVTNQTGEVITRALVTDAVPAGTTCLNVESPPTPPFWANNSPSCSAEAAWTLVYNPAIPFLSTPFNDNTTAVFTYGVRIDQPLPDGYTIVNSNYGVEARSSNSTFTDAGQPLTTTVRAPTWAISKTVSSETVEPGDYLTYTVTISNVGSLTTQGTYTVTDVLPGNTNPGSVIIDPPGFLDGGNTVTWVLADPIGVNQSRTLTYAVRATSPLTSGEVIINQTYGVSGGNVFSAAIGSPVTVTVVSSATLVITKTASSDPVQAGDLLTYTLTVAHDPASKGPAFGVTLSDTLPAEVIYQSAGFVGPASGVITDSGDPTILWELTDPLAVGDTAQVTVTVRVTSPLRPGVMTNTFAAAALNAPHVAETLATAISSTNIITLSKEVTPAVVAPGDEITYTITLTNSGNGIATITLADLLPAGFSPATYTQSSIILPGRSLFTSGSTTNVSFTATSVLTPGLYFNRIITATYDTTRTTISNVAPVHVVAAILQLTKVPNPPIVSAGDTITYTYFVTNSGDITLTNLILSDDPLGPITLGSATLAPTEGTTGTITKVVGAGDLPGPIINTATVTGTYLSDNLVTTSTIASVYSLGLVMDKQASQTTAMPGDRITYTYRITNTGSLTLTDLIIYDDEPDTTFPPLLTTLGPNQATSGTFVRNVTQADLPGPIINTATVTGTDGLLGQHTTVATDTATVSLTYTTGISLAKAVSVSTATIDQVVIYTYTLTNTGSVDLDVTLVDDHLGVITSNFLLMAGFPARIITTSYQVTPADFPGPLTNTAVVTGTDANSMVVTDTSTAVLNLDYTSGIQLQKTANVSMAIPGQVITYTYQVTNTGNVTLTGVILSDDKIGGVTVTPATIPPNQGTATGIATYTVLAGDVPAITNTAIVTGDDIFGNPVSDTATAVVNVVPVLTAITPTNSSPTPVNSTTFFTVATNLSSGVTYIWNFADGTAPTPPSASSTTNHIYTSVGTYTVVVTATNGPSTITGTTVVTITPGPLDRFVLNAATPQTAGNPFPLTITAVDQFDNVITSFNGPVNLSDSTGTLVPPVVTLVNGVTTTNITVFSATSPAFDVITATNGAASGTEQVEIQADVPTTLTLTVAPTSIRVCQSFGATATVTDNWNNPIAGQPVTMTAFMPVEPLLVSGNTNSQGIFTATMRGNGPTASGAVSAQSGSLSDLVPGLTINGPAVPGGITVTVTPATVPFNTPATATALVVDCFGNPVNGTVVTFTMGALGVITSPNTVATDASGLATVTLASGFTPGVTLITATVEGPLADDAPFTIVPPSTPVLTLTKVANPVSGPVQPGDTISYSLIISNSGTASATQVVITDVLDSGLGFVGGSISSGTGPVNSGGTVTFTLPTLGPNSQVTATIEVTVTATTSGTTVSNVATAASDQTGNIGTSNLITHQVITTPVVPAGPSYLPILLRSYQPLSDLTLVDFFITPANPSSADTVVVTIVVQNQGETSTGEGFWTDFYVNPEILPTDSSLGRDRRWNNPAINSDLGIAWAVPELAAGQVITLTSNGVGGLGPDPAQTQWSGKLPAGTHSLYAFVDSFDLNDATGPTHVEIVETDEANNLAGPLDVAIATSLEATEIKPAGELPDRSDLGRQ